jgi:peptide/nickel transport system substrate-binding protein
MKQLLKVVALLLLVALAIPVVAQDDVVTFTFGEFGNPVQLDSAVVTDGISFRVTRQGCESLLDFEGETANPVAALATDWTQSEDGLTWTLNLVEGATFHDGTPFNAEAVKFNFDRWRDTTNPYHFPTQTFEYYGAQFNGFDADSVITDVQATGEYQVTFTLSQAMPSFLNNLAMPMFSIHSPAAIEANGEAYGTPSVGYVCTGPFKFVSWESDVQVVLEKYEDYWGEFPGNVERVILRIIPDAASRLAALQDGSIDGFEGPNVEDLEMIDSSEDLYIQYRPSFNVLYLAFSYRIKEFRDPNVRKAISLAMNRQEIVDAYYNEGAIVANTFHPPTISSGFNADITAEYNVEAAKALLAEAGYPDGISEVTVLGVDENGNVTEEEVEKIPVRLYFMPVQRPYNPDGEGIGEAMVAYLQDIGIQAELASAGDWSAYLDARANGELVGLYQLGWTGDNGDPDNFIGYFFAGAAETLAREGHFQSEELGNILQQARFETDAAVRDELYKQAEQLVFDNTYRVFIAHGPVPLAFRNRVQGYIANPLGNELFKYITITE